MGERVDPTWTLTSLTQALNQHQRAIQDTEKALALAIASLKTAFVPHRGTPPDDFYISHRQQLGADESERARIYHRIDSLSSLAAAYAVPNEYDKMIKKLGARGTNAYISTERTVYVNDVPADE